MPMHWDVSKVRNHDELCFRPGDAAYHENPTGRYLKPMALAMVNTLGWAGVGGEITENNADELVLRVAFYQQLNGALLRRGNGEPWAVTPEDVLRHVGLSATWGFRKQTRSAWLKWVSERWVSEQSQGILSWQLAEAREKIAFEQVVPV